MLKDRIIVNRELVRKTLLESPTPLQTALDLGKSQLEREIKQNKEKFDDYYDRSADTRKNRPTILSKIVLELGLDEIAEKDFTAKLSSFFDNLIDSKPIDDKGNTYKTKIINKFGTEYKDELDVMIKHYERTGHSGSTDKLREEAGN